MTRRTWVVGTVVGLAGWWMLRAAERTPPIPAVISAVGMPVGALVPFAGPGSMVPEDQGWLLCDGREVESRLYPELERVIGSSWGRAAALGHLRLPDLRGRFVRGVNAGASAADHDPEATSRRASAPGGNEGDGEGSFQDDAVGSHHHPISGVADAVGAGAGGEWVRFFATKVPDENAPVVRNHAAVEAPGGAETRPRNVAVNWMIRAR